MGLSSAVLITNDATAADGHATRAIDCSRRAIRAGPARRRE
jgi:hypothetical protein